MKFYSTFYFSCKYVLTKARGFIGTASRNVTTTAKDCLFRCRMIKDCVQWEWLELNTEDQFNGKKEYK